MTDFLSLCCNKPVETVYGNEGTNHFVCTGCDKACDTRSGTQEKWVEEFTNIVDEYQIAHKGNYQCKCISGARGHLIAKSIDFIRKTREEAKREERDRIYELANGLHLEPENLKKQLEEFQSILDSLTSK